MALTRRFLSRLTLLLLAVMAPAVCQAQLPLTRLDSLFPAGGQAGTTVEVKVTSGEDLEEISQIRFSHPGIQGSPRTQMVDGQPQPVERTFDVNVSPDVPAGIYEAYIKGYWGWSNPRAFVVGQQPEVLETEPNSRDEEANPVELGRVINGRMDQATDVDCFKFTAQKGTRVVADCRAMRIDSRLDPVLEVFDLHGRKLAYLRSARHDATLVFDPPEDGEFVLRVFDQTFRNGPDYFYRLTLKTGPQIAFVLPPAGAAGSTGHFSLYGFNLPGGQPTEATLHRAALERLDVDIPVPGDPTTLDVDGRVKPVEAGTDAFTWRLDSPRGPSNPIRIQIGDTPSLLEQEPNNNAAQAQLLTVPCDLGGQFATPGDEDVLAFDVKSGDVWWIEVFGERLAAETDPTLIVEHVGQSADGHEQVTRIAVQDDINVDLAPNAFDTQTDDATFRFTAPGDGRCRITLKDRYGETRGNPALVYRLVVRPESPDFRLVALPAQMGLGQTAATMLRRGDDLTLDILAFRRHGFTGAISVRAEDLPAGVSCAGTVIGPNQILAPLVLTSTVDTLDAFSSMRLVGHAELEPPAQAQAAAAAVSALEAAKKPVFDLRKAAGQEASRLQQAAEQSVAAVQALNAQPGDAARAAQLIEKQQQLQAASESQRQAIEKLLAAEKTIAEAQASRDQARAALAAATQPVDRPVRIATTVWSTANNHPAYARIARELPVGVMNEAAAYQLRTGVQQVEVRQGGQVLVPVTLERRNGFDGEVQVAINGRPNNSNIDGNNFKFDKDQQEFLLPLFVKENVAPDTYALFLTGQAPVSYRRNPEKAERAKAEFDKQAALAKAAQEESQRAEAAKNDAVQKRTAAEQTVEQSKAAQQKSAEESRAAADVAQTGKDALAAADAKAVTAAQRLTDASDALAAARKELEDAADNEDLKQKVAAAEEAVATARKSMEQADEEKTGAARKLAESEAVAVKAVETLKTAEQAVQDAEAAKSRAEAEQAQAEQALTEAQQKAQSEEQGRQEAEKKSNQAAESAKPKNLNFTPNSPAIIIAVRPAPLKLSVNASGGGQLKRGDRVEVKTTITRQNGFDGPVQLTLVAAGVDGVAAEPVTIPADQTEATLIVTATGDAPEGPVANAVVRALSDDNGPAAVDARVGLKIAP